MVTPLVLIGILFFACLGELILRRRTRALAPLAFGPGEGPRPWTRLAPLLRIAACLALAWGLLTLLLLPPKAHRAQALEEGEERHLVLVLDVSPSMRLEDAGPELDQGRLRRAADVLDSFFKRLPIVQVRVSVVAVYSGAKRVVVDTRDMDVVRNILLDLPMHYAFQPGQTQLMRGLEEASLLARPWNPKSTTVIVISDGDTLPGQDLPKMPVSVEQVLVVGVGDPRAGSFIDGRQSRQDVTTLRQIARRLKGIYHNGNQKHLSSETLSLLLKHEEEEAGLGLSRREVALLAIALGASLLALLPLALLWAGTAWTPGVPLEKARSSAPQPSAP